MKTYRYLMTGTGIAASLIAAFAMVSCSTAPGNSRVPASEPRVYWNKAEKNLSVGQGGLHDSFNVEVQQITEWTESVPYQDTCYKDGVNEEPGTCEGYHCSQSGTGKSEAWNAFYSASQSGKADALANAIKGVGASTAQKLVAAGYFHSKPRSWEDFSNEIQRAADSDVIGKDIPYQVLVKYKSENVTNLGYDVSGCTTYQYSCTVYTPGVVSYSCTKYKDQTYTKVVDRMNRQVSIDVSNPVLQSFETDTASIKVGHDTNDVEVEIGPYNRYNVQTVENQDMARIRAVGAQRILVDLPRAAVRSGTLQKRDTGAVFDLKINSQYLGSDRDQLVLKYNVYTCKMNFFSMCLNSFKPGSDVTVPVTQSETVINIPIDHKTKSKVVYSLARKGSRWYNDSFISSFETDAVGQK